MMKENKYKMTNLSLVIRIITRQMMQKTQIFEIGDRYYIQNEAMHHGHMDDAMRHDEPRLLKMLFMQGIKMCLDS